MKRRIFSTSYFKPGFTIVELLVVIVVIGTLAAITIVSYVGISQKAVAAALQADLSSASKQLELFSIANGVFPVTIDCDIPDSATNKCIKKSSDSTSYEYQSGMAFNNPTFTLVPASMLNIG